MIIDAAAAILRAFPPETAHRATIAAAKYFAPLLPRGPADDPRLAVDALGLSFDNPVGLAAGFDKNAEACEAMGRLGFGFVECGTVTPRPQAGNPRPRLFRLEEDRAVINRMGFNNDGMEAVLRRMRRATRDCIVGINIGANKDSADRIADYAIAYDRLFAVADYVTVNVSSPNTKGLRELQSEDALAGLVVALKSEQKRLADKHAKYTPIAVKVAPDLAPAAIDGVARVLARHKIDAVIATNTTTSRDGVKGRAHAEEAGGLSGRPLREQATAVVARIAKALDGALPIIGVGGIMNGADAKEKIDAGATLVQLYTGLVYRGPELVVECAEALVDR